MELHQLRYFVAVAQDLHFTRAAARVHVTQQAISKAVAALERELGVALLVRRPRGCSLTAEGHVFLADALAVLDRTEKARRVAHRDGRRPGPEVRVITMTSAYDHLLDGYRDAFPETRLEVRRAANADEVLVPLLAEECDVLLAPSRFDADADVVVDVLASEPRAALVPAASEFAAAPTLDVADVLGACFGPRHPLEPLHWEGDWCLVPERGEQPRRAAFDLPDEFDRQIRTVAEAGCVITQGQALLADFARWSGGLMVSVPMPAARPVEVTLTTTARTNRRSSVVTELREFVCASAPISAPTPPTP